MTPSIPASTIKITVLRTIGVLCLLLNVTLTLFIGLLIVTAFSFDVHLDAVAATLQLPIVVISRWLDLRLFLTVWVGTALYWFTADKVEAHRGWRKLEKVTFRLSLVGLAGGGIWLLVGMLFSRLR